jgi:hypothetical protein
MVKLSVGTSSDFITNTWLKINEDGTWNMFACASLREKGVKGIITTTDSLIGRHLTIRLNTVL